MTQPINAVVLGVGGTGYHLAPTLARILAPIAGSTLYLVDGKVIREDHVARQFGVNAADRNKAEVMAEQLSEMTGGALSIRAMPLYYERVSKLSHSEWLTLPNLHVFSCVDNNASRAFFEAELGTRDQLMLIDGGNDMYSGQAVVWERVDGADITPRPSAIDPEILSGDQALPSEVGCDVAAVHAPQHVLANIASAFSMLSLWYARTASYPALAKPHSFGLQSYARFDTRATMIRPSREESLEVTIQKALQASAASV